MKKVIPFLVSIFIFTSCGENNNKESRKAKNIDTPDTLVLQQVGGDYIMKRHTSHASHASHRSHFSQH